MPHKITACWGANTPLPITPVKSEPSPSQPGTYCPLTCHKTGVRSPAVKSGTLAENKYWGLGLSSHHRILWPKVTRHILGERGCLQIPSQKTGVNGKITSIALIAD